MTIKEAEEIWFLAVDKKMEEQETTKHWMKVIIIIGSIFLGIGGIVLAVGFSLPKEESYWNGIVVYKQSRLASNIKIASVFILLVGIGLFFAAGILALDFNKKDKEMLSARKELYANYLRCVDMSEEEKEYYKQKLEEIRYAELASKINRL